MYQKDRVSGGVPVTLATVVTLERHEMSECHKRRITPKSDFNLLFFLWLPVLVIGGELWSLSPAEVQPGTGLRPVLRR